jgi:hypothetical protein
LHFSNLIAILQAHCTEFVRVESYINDGKMFQSEKKMKVEGVEWGIGNERRGRRKYYIIRTS